MLQRQIAELSSRDASDRDTVSDYRLLAESFDWEEYFTGSAAAETLRILDVGCGSGRFLRALDIYVPEIRRLMVRHEYCGLDPSLEALNRIAGFTDQLFGSVALVRDSVMSAPIQRGTFDRVLSVHSLYASPPAGIGGVIERIWSALGPEGVATIVLSEPDAFYATAIVDLGESDPFSSAEDVRTALVDRCIGFEQHNIVYDELISAVDQDAVQKYIAEEAIGNSFAVNMPLESQFTGIEQLHAFRRDRWFAFPQNAAVISFRRDTSKSSSLRPSSRELRTLASTALDFVLRDQSQTDGGPVFVGTNLAPLWQSESASQPANWADPKIAAVLNEAAPDQPSTDLEALLHDVVGPLALAGTADNSPGYFGYIPSGGLFHSAIADLISAGLNRYVPLAETAPGLSAIEHLAVRWISESVGFSSAAAASGGNPSGVLLSGGASATQHAVYAARCATSSVPAELVAYSSASAHSCVAEALDICGIGHHRVLETDGKLRLRLDHLRAAIRSDRDAGLKPFLTVGTAGDVRAGAVDDLLALREICDDEDLWMHVDASYGGFFAMVEAGRIALAGMELADSIVLDPHKGLGLPYGTGALLVKDESTLLGAYASGASYLNPSETEQIRAVNPLDLGLEYTRSFRGLRVWLPLKLLGLNPFKDNLALMLDLTVELTDALRMMDGLEILVEPTLSICLFRLQYPFTDADNRALLDAINSGGEFFVTGCDVPEHIGSGFAIRVALLSFRSDRTIVHRLVARIEEVLEGFTTTGTRPIDPNDGDAMHKIDVAHPDWAMVVD